MQRRYLATLFTLLLVACSPDGSTPKIAEGQRDVMEDAKQVESVLQQNAEQQRAQADEQTPQENPE